MKNCFYPADILLPKFAKDAERMKKWACVACDQYTSEPSYWEDVAAMTAGEPSTLRLILPECYLAESAKRTPEINAAMGVCLDNVLENHPSSMIYLKRTLPSGKVRRGLIGAIDLECYDFNKGAVSLIRATEGTVLERIPPRVAIRSGATLELPHIMILIDDPMCQVIEPLEDVAMETAYDFDLMKDSGHVKGGFLPESEQTRVSQVLDRLCVGENPLLFAVGDGNHSLAAAKTCWEQLKPWLSEEEKKNHPARFALVELVNIHDKALEFEPIYRVLFDVDPEMLPVLFRAYADTLPDNSLPAQEITLVTADRTETVVVENPTSFLPVGTLQTFLDTFLAYNKTARIDYIHGEDTLKTLANQPYAVGFLFKGMEKKDLFPTVITDGALPRKTFSMGHAADKRFYLEARKLRK